MLELKQISKSFKNKKVLSNINLSFDDTGFVAIIGESGSGKSTLINIMSGIEAPDSGELYFNHKSISYENERTRIKSILKQVAYMPQRQILLNDKTVYENLKEILELFQIDDESQINTVLKQVRLNEKYKNRLVSTLSTGEAQRVCIALNLLKQANILVLDEATENLDEANREFIFGILKEISKEKLVVLVTHDTFMAKKYVDRMITISNREIYSDEVFSNDSISIQEISKDESIVGKKRKKLSVSFTNIIIYMLVPLIMIFLTAIFSIYISPNIYDVNNYPSGYYHINQDKKEEFTEEEFKLIYQEENTYFIFNLSLILDSVCGYIDYDFNYNTSKKIMSYNEVIVSDTFLKLNKVSWVKYKKIDIIPNEKPILIMNYDLVLEHYLESDSKSEEAAYAFYKNGGFESKFILSTNPKKTLALNLPIENSLDSIKNFMRNNFAMQFKFGMTICIIMLALCIALYIVFANKETSYYFNVVAFYRVCGQTNTEIRKKLKGKLYIWPIGLILFLSGTIYLILYLIFTNIGYDIYVFRFDAKTYLISFGLSVGLLVLLNELKNFIILKTQLKKLIKLR